MSRPSEPLLRWLRGILDQRGMNAAALAAELDRPRGDVRRLLTGAMSMTVDDLVAIGEVLDVSPEELGVALPTEDALDAGVTSLPAPEGPRWGNQPRACFELGFASGMDFMFQADASLLGDWGGPDAVLTRYDGQLLPIRLDAAYHQHMDPHYDDDALELSLSFDRVYRCRFPWSAVAQVVFLPQAPEPPPAEAPVPVDDPSDEDPPDDDPPKGPPTLRLVKS